MVEYGSGQNTHAPVSSAHHHGPTRVCKTERESIAKLACMAMPLTLLVATGNSMGPAKGLSTKNRLGVMKRLLQE